MLIFLAILGDLLGWWSISGWIIALVIIAEPFFWLLVVNLFRDPDDWYGT